MSTTMVKHGEEHNFKANVLQSKAGLNATYSNASNIKVTLTTILDLYLMEQDPSSFRSKLMWLMPSSQI
jgi:hypothetical protein